MMVPGRGLPYAPESKVWTRCAPYSSWKYNSN